MHGSHVFNTGWNKKGDTLLVQIVLAIQQSSGEFIDTLIELGIAIAVVALN